MALPLTEVRLDRALLGLLAAAAASATPAQTMEQLREMLAQRDATIAELRQRLAHLEPPDAAEQPSSSLPADRRALERALVRQGNALLPPGAYEIEPMFGLGYDPTGHGTTYDASLAWRIGLPLDMQIEGSVPYTPGSYGRRGLGSFDVGLLKNFALSQGQDASNVQAWLRRRFSGLHASGSDDAGTTEVGLGIHRRLDPMIVSGSATVWRPPKGAGSGLGLTVRPGATLALRPGLAWSFSMDLGRLPRRDRIEDAADEQRTERNFAVLNFAFDVAVTPRWLLSAGVGLRVTGPAPKIRFFVSTPLRDDVLSAR